MPLFKLEKFPFVCRLCLQPEQHRQMTSLDTEDEVFEGGATYEQYLAALTFRVEEEKRHLFPRSICAPCRDLLRMFARFRNKVRQVHLFMNALVELRDFNTAPMKSLFTSSRTLKLSMRAMLAELGLCQSGRPRARELIDEFPQYRIASLPAVLGGIGFVGVDVKEETVSEPVEGEEEEEEEDDDGPEENVLYAEECSPEELLGLTGGNATEVVETNETSLGTAKVESGIKWEFLDDSDEEMDVPAKASRRKPRKKRETSRTNVRHDWDTILAKPLTIESIENPKVAQATKIYGGPSSKEPLQCPKCPYKTHRKGTFHSHQLTHLLRENKKHTCKVPDCSAEFTDRRYLASHVEKKHRSWICDECGLQCSNRGYLNMHKVRIHSKNPPSFSCEYCQQIFKLKLDMQVHIKRVHLAESMFKCGTCGLEFKRKCTRDSHEICHSNVYNCLCQQCDKKFKLPAQLRKHIRRVHKNPNLHCEHCSKPFYTRDNMLNHIEHVHGIQMRFLCDICLASFESQEKLTTHKTRHEHPKLFECARCLLVFGTQELFFDHLCITYRDDYVCCGRDFHDHLPYNRHVFLRHGLKVNARVKPQPGVLLGTLRAQRKRFEICQNCDACFPTRIAKKQHQETCLAGGEGKL